MDFITYDFIFTILIQMNLSLTCWFDFFIFLGCWVPARAAVIPVMDAIYSRIQTVDSVALGLSAFTIDLNQISKAMNNATSQSLILVDEFGKGKINLTEKNDFFRENVFLFH